MCHALPILLNVTNYMYKYIHIYIGVLPHQVAPEGKKIQVETDQGVYEGGA